MLGATLYTFSVVAFLGICGGYATSRIAGHLPCSGNGDDEAARAGGKSRDDPFSHGPYGDWPAIPEDLKSHRFHSERNTL